MLTAPLTDQPVPQNPQLNDRWNGIIRPYSPEQVKSLRGSVPIAHTLADVGARRLWTLLRDESFVPALGALTGAQAVQMVRAGLKAIYLSGWQVAADGDTAGQTYRAQSPYPPDSVPVMVRRINRALPRTDADSARLLLSDADPRDHPFIVKRERTAEGFFHLRGGLDHAIARGLAYAPYADVLWCETSTPDLSEARRFAEAIHAEYPAKL